MFFFPYKLDINLSRIPLLTILVCLACIATFLFQLKSQTAFVESVKSYCAQDIDANLRAMLNAVDDDEIEKGCANVFLGIRAAHDRDHKISELAREVSGLDFYPDKDADIKYKESAIRYGFDSFETLVPKQLTEKLEYQPDRYNVVAMVTSTFAHGSWSHLIGNLVFFFIFASCVECALGYMYFTLSFLAMTVVTSLAYSHNVAATEALPSIGLSGVAMGMMAMLTTILPRARVWCFFWILFFFRRFTLPVLVIAAWYIGWNIWDLTHRPPNSHIDYMAHVSGAVCGIFLGALYRIVARKSVQELMAGAS